MPVLTSAEHYVLHSALMSRSVLHFQTEERKQKTRGSLIVWLPKISFPALSWESGQWGSADCDACCWHSGLDKFSLRLPLQGCKFNLAISHMTGLSFSATLAWPVHAAPPEFRYGHKRVWRCSFRIRSGREIRQCAHQGRTTEPLKQKLQTKLDNNPLASVKPSEMIQLIQPPLTQIKTLELLLKSIVTLTCTETFFNIVVFRDWTLLKCFPVVIFVASGACILSLTQAHNWMFVYLYKG